MLFLKATVDSPDPPVVEPINELVDLDQTVEGNKLDLGCDVLGFSMYSVYEEVNKRAGLSMTQWFPSLPAC